MTICATKSSRNCQRFRQAQILAEPAQRNTAPAIGLAAHILQSIDPDSVMGVFPADHLISKPNRYLRLLRPAFRAAEQGEIAVMGIQPRWAETGYGYIEFDKGVKAGSLEPLPVRRFREKPDREHREAVCGRGPISSGMPGCSSGEPTFCFRLLREHLRKPLRCSRRFPAFASPPSRRNCSDIYPLCENISVDYAVLEKAKNVVGLGLRRFRME